MPIFESWSILNNVSGHLQVINGTINSSIAKRNLPAHSVGRTWHFKRTGIDARVRPEGDKPFSSHSP